MLRIADCTGSWQAEATVPGGGRYDGVVDVRLQEQALLFDWRISAGHYVGIGVIADDALYVACGERHHGLALGLADRADARFRWWLADGVEREVALVDGDPQRYELAAPVPGFRTLAVHAVGETLELALDGRAQAGLAWATPRGHAFAWYPDFTQLAMLRYVRGHGARSLVARWALGGQPLLGDESMRRVR